MRALRLALLGPLFGGCLLVSSPEEVQVVPASSGSNDAGDSPSAGSGGSAGASGATGSGGTSNLADAATQGMPDAAIDPDAGGTCEPTARMCQGDDYRLCNDAGQWGTPTPCAFTCRGGRCTVCMPGTGRCQDGRAEQCDDTGNWDEGVDCPVLCVQGQCQTSCEQGSMQCDDKTPQTCIDNAWQDGTPCAIDCLGEGECADCTPDDKQCASNTQAEVCNAMGQWEQTDCIDQTCYGDQCTGVCAPGDTECEDPSTLNTCNAMGQFDDTDCTASDQTCVEGAAPAQCTGDCAPGYQRCVDNRVQDCNASGAYADATDCDDLTQACVESGDTAGCQGDCIPDTEACEDNTPSVCSQDGAYGATGAQCSWPNFICEVDTGTAACVSNPPYNLGEYTQYAGTSTLGTNWLLGNWVDVADDVQVVSLGLIAYGHSGGCKIRLALYNSMGGEPNARLGYTSQFDQPTVTTSFEQATIAQFNITPGRYWIMAHYTQCTGSPAVFRLDADTEPDLRYAVHNTDPPPASFPTMGVTSFTTFGVNHYLVVRNLP